MSNTPLTDAACGEPVSTRAGWEATAVRLCDCSIKLELALTAERERNRRLESFAERIRDAGGTTTEEGLTCNGSWCAEQARVFLAGEREEKT